MELNLCSNASNNVNDFHQESNKEASKIHQLGQKKSRTLNNEAYRVFPMNYKSFCKSVKVGLPISLCIPQTDINHLMKQLQDLKIKYNHLQKNANETSILQKKIFEDVANMTKNFQMQMSRVINQSRVIQRQNNQQLQELKQIHINNCDDMLQTLNEATTRLSQLQQKNKILQQKYREEKQKNQRILKENQHLVQRIKGIESGKENIIQGIKSQLQKFNQLKLKESQYSFLNQNNN